LTLVVGTGTIYPAGSVTLELRYGHGQGTMTGSSSGGDGRFDEGRDGPNLVGRVLGGRFHLLELIGAGAVGRIWRAEQRPLGRTVAVKTLSPALSGDPKAVERFRLEAMAASRLNHPNIVSIIDFGVDTGAGDDAPGHHVGHGESYSRDAVLFLAMEFVPGRNLATMAAQEGGMAPLRVAQLMVQTLDALSAAHQMGIVHRDLKPDNIMVARSGLGDHVKVADFGIAKVLQGTSLNLTGEGFVCGTPGFMAPEQIRGEELDPRADLYAVGCVLYELLAGRPPFEDDSWAELLLRHVTDTPPPPSAVAAGVDPRLEAVALKAMDKDRNRRFASAAEMRDALIVAVSTPGVAAAHGPGSTAPGGGVAGAIPLMMVTPGGGVPAAGPVGARAGARPPATPAAFKEEDTLRGHPQPVSETTKGGGPAWEPPSGELPGPIPAEPFAVSSTQIETDLGGNRMSGRESSVPRDAGRGGTSAGAVEDSRPTYTDPPRFLFNEETEVPAAPWPPAVVGRAQTIEAIEAALAQRSNVVVVLGPAGSGRSTLARTLLKRAAERGAQTALVTRPLSLVPVPYGALSRWVSTRLGLPPWGPRVDRSTVMRAVKARGVPEADSMAVSFVLGNSRRLDTLALESRQVEVAAAVARLMRSGTERSEMVWAVDDVDLFDRPSAQYVRGFAMRLRPTEKVILLGARGAEALAPPGAPQIVLDPLKPAEVELLVQLVVPRGTPPPFDPAWPGHIEQWVRADSEGAGGVSTSVVDLCSARIDRLGFGPRRVLQLLAASGGEISIDWIATALELPPSEVKRIVELLDTRGLAYDHGNGVAVCSHPLVREVAYASTPVQVRRTLHLALLRLLGPLSPPAMVAAHAEAAGEQLAAAHAHLRAGEEAARFGDDQSASDHFFRGAELVRQTPISQGDLEVRELRVNLALRAAEALARASAVAASDALLEVALEASRGSASLEAQARAAMARLRGARSTDDAERHLRGAIASSLAVGERDLLVSLYLDLADWYAGRGDPHGAIRELNEGIDLVTMGGGPTSEEGPAGTWRLLLRLSELQVKEADTATARSSAQAAYQHAARCGSALGRARAAAQLGVIAGTQGDLIDARERFYEAAAELRRLGDRRSAAEQFLIVAQLEGGYADVVGARASCELARALALEAGWWDGATRAAALVRELAPPVPQKSAG
jgi:serine/threonine-protein kinase